MENKEYPDYVYVYKLVNINSNEIEYIGISNHPAKRFYGGHLSETGKFYGRTDLCVTVLERCDNRKQALRKEGEYKINNGFAWTEKISGMQAKSKWAFFFDGKKP